MDVPLAWTRRGSADAAAGNDPAAVSINRAAATWVVDMAVLLARGLRPGVGAYSPKRRGRGPYFVAAAGAGSFFFAVSRLMETETSSPSKAPPVSSVLFHTIP
jgi:hypothetical protein